MHSTVIVIGLPSVTIGYYFKTNNIIKVVPLFQLVCLFLVLCADFECMYVSYSFCLQWPNCLNIINNSLSWYCIKKRTTATNKTTKGQRNICSVFTSRSYVLVDLFIKLNSISNDNIRWIWLGQIQHASEENYVQSVCKNCI